MKRWTRSVLLAAAASACRPGASEPAAGYAAQEAEVLATVERFFEAMTARDVAAYEELLVPEAVTFSQRIGPDGPGPLRIRTNREHMESLGADTSLLEERMWDPVVKVHGPIAMVWTPYDFHIDGRFSHCGIDVFEFLRVDGRWKMTNASWTVETVGCDPGPPPFAGDLEGEKAAILDVVERTFAAMATRDVEAYAATLVPEATSFSQYVGPDGPGAVTMRTNAEDVAAFGSGTGSWQERIEDPFLLVHPPVAVMWAPYDFHVDGEFSHCGVDTFQFLKVAGEWRMAGASWTVEPEGCVPGPPGSIARPAGWTVGPGR